MEFLCEYEETKNKGMKRWMNDSLINGGMSLRTNERTNEREKEQTLISEWVDE